MNDDDMLRAWAASARVAAPELETVRASSTTFNRRIARRNWTETIAAALVILIFTIYAITIPSPLVRVASVAIIVGALVVVWQLYRRASTLVPPDDADVVPLLHHRRTEVDRQRRALETVVIWYVGPLLPGTALFLAAPIIEGDASTATYVRIAVVALVFASVVWLNRRAARTLAKEIGEIDAMLAES